MKSKKNLTVLNVLKIQLFLIFTVFSNQLLANPALKCSQFFPWIGHRS
jgi:hypothetical protein